MSRNWTWNILRVFAAVLCFAMLGTVSCTQPDTGGGDKTKPKGTSGPCG